MIDNDGDNDDDDDDDDDDDEHITSSSPSALHAATGPLGRPRSTPVRERPGLSHPHSVDAAVGSSCASPNKTDFGDLGVERSSPRPVKASVGTRKFGTVPPILLGYGRNLLMTLPKRTTANCLVTIWRPISILPLYHKTTMI